MKIVSMTLSRESAYSTRIAALKAAPWKATVYVAGASAFAEEREIPVHIAQAMANAAYEALLGSGFFEPVFDSDTVDEVAEEDAAEQPAPPPPLSAEDADQVTF